AGTEELAELALDDPLHDALDQGTERLGVGATEWAELPRQCEPCGFGRCRGRLLDEAAGATIWCRNRNGHRSASGLRGALTPLVNGSPRRWSVAVSRARPRLPIYTLICT